jgi:uncharacterized membrane protein
VPEKPLQQRLDYIDWLRGLACVLMFQTHCYDSWLGGAARTSTFELTSQFGGTLPAPLFLFLAGISFALVTDRMRKKNISANQIAVTTIRRGAEILGFGLLFRVQEFLLGQPGAPWTDLLRVDVLNIIGVSMMLMGVACRLTSTRRSGAILAAAVAVLIAVATPPLWTTHRPRFLPWYLESYINGVHIFDKPQAWLFPLFPWAAFAFAGLAAGWAIVGGWPKKRRFWFLGFAAAGVAMYVLAMRLDANPIHIYAVYDFWHSSPNFWLARTGVIFVLVGVSYAWCEWGLGARGFRPLLQLGKTSLLVYWVHIEFVYGRFSILPKRAETIPQATAGLIVIFLCMLALSVARTGFKNGPPEIFDRLPWRMGRPFQAGEARSR